ncbi:2-oxoglutarate-dependent dioxygenase [Aspergillus alliaceus]|uniref:2-oxoglutarate-dependent dioxygenase n=1 Tax=Petromyces alliaceus TaxID=209559 RepID=UPI0012A6F728|nr:oxidoreductase [Aspergillus alliaceus]KAB8228277.1 oxidoreductase [Aspergillus alliaceus]
MAVNGKVIDGTDGKYVAAGIDMSDLFPASFPTDVKTVHLETLSLAKLLERDENELRRIYDNCKNPGFFQLDLTDDEQGVQLLRDAVDCARLMKRLLPNMSVEEKRTYKQHTRVGVYSKGYQVYEILPNGQPKYNETVNFPMTEMLGYGGAPVDLPDWLSPHQELFQRTMRSGNKIANIVLAALEVGLQVPPGALTDAHHIQDPSDDFLRLLRYPGLQPDQPRDDLRFPAHKDFTSLGILFTWLGGLQLPASAAAPSITSGTMTGPLDIIEDSWRWVKPVPGTAIVNVGNALEILTNKALTSGLHRVVRAPGEQVPFDRYSVLIGTRPANNFSMKPLQSPQISPVLDPSAAEIAKMTSGQWGTHNIGSFNNWVKARKERQDVLIIP